MSKNIRLLQVLAGAPQGGAEEFFTRLTIALQQRGINQEVVIRTDEKRAARLQGAGVVCHQANFGTAWLDFATHSRLHKIIQQFAPNIVLSWMNRATAFVSRSKHYSWAARLGGYYNLKYYKDCDYLIGNTPDIVEYFIKNDWPATRTLYLPNFAAAEKLPAIARMKLDTPADAPLFLALGRLHPNKAFDTLLNAMALVPKAYLWLAGEGDVRGALEQQAQQLGIADRVRLLGWRDDSAALLATADYFICPSRHEPLGNVILEAMAHSKPIIAANSQGPSQLLTHEGTGLLVPVDDAASMAAAMQRLMDNRGLTIALATAAHAHYQSHFSEESVCQKYMAAFQQMIGGC